MYDFLDTTIASGSYVKVLEDSRGAAFGEIGDFQSCDGGWYFGMESV